MCPQPVFLVSLFTQLKSNHLLYYYDLKSLSVLTKKKRKKSKTKNPSISTDSLLRIFYASGLPAHREQRLGLILLYPHPLSTCTVPCKHNKTTQSFCWTVTWLSVGWPQWLQHNLVNVFWGTPLKTSELLYLVIFNYIIWNSLSSFQNYS